MPEAKEAKQAKEGHVPCPHCTRVAGPGVAAGWHRRSGPAPALQARHHQDPSLGWVPRWADHRWRYRLDDGRWCYVAEPYSLGEEALEDLAWLGEHGFEVLVTAHRARHYPGHTVAVEITLESTR